MSFLKEHFSAEARAQRKSTRAAEKSRQEAARRNLAEIQTELRGLIVYPELPADPRNEVYNIRGADFYLHTLKNEEVHNMQYAAHHLMAQRDFEDTIEAAEAKRDSYATRHSSESKQWGAEMWLESLKRQKSAWDGVIDQARQSFEYRHAYDTLKPLLSRLEVAYSQVGKNGRSAVQKDLKRYLGRS